MAANAGEEESFSYLELICDGRFALDAITAVFNTLATSAGLLLASECTDFSTGRSVMKVKISVHRE
jgi:hypothetical protein